MPVKHPPLPDDETLPPTLDSDAGSADSLSADTLDHLSTLNDGGSSFEAQTTRAMQRIHGALRDLVSAIPGDIRRPIDLQRSLKLDSKLCWQVFKIIKPEQLLSAAQHVPGTPSLNRLLAAAGAANVPSATIDAVRSAIDQFNETVTLHASDRGAFDSMVTAASDESGSSVDLFHRRNAYRSESHIWGVQVGTYINANFVHPSVNPDNKDDCSLVVRIGQRRLRADAPLVVLRHHNRMMSADQADKDRAGALDGHAFETYGAPLLPEFSSSPMPPFKTVYQDGGWTQIEVSGGAVGQQASMNFAFGRVQRDLPFVRTPEGLRVLNQNIRFITPAELLVMDVFVHRPTYGAIDPQLIVYPRTDGVEPPAGLTGLQRLPIREPISVIPVNSLAMGIPEFKKYSELLRWTCRRLNWSLSEFDLYRVRLPYPVLNSICRMFATLGE